MTNINIELLDYIYDDSGRIDWDASVLGQLDVSSHSEFPLALTFTIAEIRNITARKGSFSKTFKIPATKNNNKIYKSVYIANSYSANDLTNKKNCRILFNDLYSLSGLLQLSAVGTFENPEYYSCVFFGDNIGWATSLGEKLLKDLGTDGDGWEYLNGKTTDGLPADGTNGVGVNLQINKESISGTWDNDDAEYKTRSTTAASQTAIVYPVTSYGDFNSSGEDYTLQLLDTFYTYRRDFTGSPVGANKLGYFGYNDNGFNYGTPQPVVDWRPCIWVYDMLKQIFIEAGYRIESNFIESETFKRLLFVLPNFKYNNADYRYELYSLKIRYNLNQSSTSSKLVDLSPHGATMNGANYVTIYNQAIDLSSPIGFNKSLDGSSGFNPSADEFTVSEYGKYNISLSNFCIHFNDFQNSSSNVAYKNLQLEIRFVRVNVRVKTVGQANYATVGYMEGAVDLFLNCGNSNFSTGNQGQNVNFTAELENFELTQYFNKNDKIQLWLEIQGRATQADFGTSSTESITGHYGLYGSKNISSGHTHDGVFGFSIDPLNAAYGQTYNLKDVINKEYKQLDFVKGLSHAFNLQFTTNETNKTVTIEPFDSFYKPLAEASDWTYLLDRSKETTDKWVEQSLTTDIVFKYKSDSNDVKVEERGKNYFKDILDEYPYFETLSDKFEKGTTTFENPFFAGTFNAKDKDSVINETDPPYIGCLWNEKEDGTSTSPNDWERPVQGNNFQPRLLYWKKYSPAGQDLTPKRASIQHWVGATQSIIANKDQTSATSVLSKIYPQATSANRDDSATALLTYGNVWVRDYDDVNNEYTEPPVIGSGLFDTYYRGMIEMIKYNPRIRIAYVNLKVKDIVNLDMNRLIYIDGVYWRLNKVIDYMPHQNKATKVELIEWLELGEQALTNPDISFSDGSWEVSDGGTIDDNNQGF